MSTLSDPNYQHWLGELKQTIQSSQQSAALAVNKCLLKLYWQLGQSILQQQKKQGWGAKVIQQVAKDLKQAFPHLKGFSRANLMYMRSFAEAWPSFSDDSIVQQAVGQLPWGHNLVLLSKVKVTDNNKPIGVAEYQLSKALPADLEEKLPSIARIKAELAKELGSEHE